LVLDDSTRSRQPPREVRGVRIPGLHPDLDPSRHFHVHAATAFSPSTARRPGSPPVFGAGPNARATIAHAMTTDVAVDDVRLHGGTIASVCPGISTAGSAGRRPNRRAEP
jgi:hypothetical protein